MELDEQTQNVIIKNNNYNKKLNLCYPSYRNPPSSLAIADTGSTGNFLHIDSPSVNKIPTPKGISVRMPNETHITSTHTCELPLINLPREARQAHLFPELSSGSLLSIGQLCDNGCTATFDKNVVKIKLHDTTVLEGPRNHTTGLWYVSLCNEQSPFLITTKNKLYDTKLRQLTPQALSAYHTSTLPELAQFLHAACFSPTLATFLAAINAGFLATWPGLTTQLITKHLPKSIAMTK